MTLILTTWVALQFGQALFLARSRHLDNNERCRDTAEHSGCGFEIDGDHIAQRVLIHLLLVVDAVLFHHSFEFRLEHPGNLNRELLDAQRGVLGCVLLALLALLDGFRRQPCCSSAMACLFKSVGR